MLQLHGNLALILVLIGVVTVLPGQANAPEKIHGMRPAV